MRLEESTVAFMGSWVRGGWGVDADCGPVDGGDGGTGMELGPNSHAYLRDSDVLGGPGGSDAGLCMGFGGADGEPFEIAPTAMTHELPSVERRLEVSLAGVLPDTPVGVVLEGQTVELQIFGTPGDQVSLRTSSETQMELRLAFEAFDLSATPGVAGPSLPGASHQPAQAQGSEIRFPRELGLIPATGVLRRRIPIGDLAAGAATIFMQARVRDAQGVTTLAGSQFLVV